MKMIKGLLSISVLFVGLGLCTRSSAQKAKLVAAKEPSVVMAMDIKNDIIVPVNTLAKKNADPLVKELSSISNDLYKLAYNKIAAKYDAFMNACKSFEPGLLDSEFKFAYLESWIDLTNKRVRKLGDYKERLAKIQERLAAFDKKLSNLKDTEKGANAQLRSELAGYSAKLKEKISMTGEWIERSDRLFTNELNKIKSREKAFKKAGVPRA